MITDANWYDGADWITELSGLLWDALKGDARYVRLMGNGTWRTFDEEQLRSEDIMPKDCPYTGMYQAGITLGRICPGGPDKETVTIGVRLAQATNRMADIRTHVLAFRRALYDYRTTIWTARESSLADIRFQNVNCVRYPGPDTAPRPIWVADLSLVCWFPPPIQ